MSAPAPDPAATEAAALEQLVRAVTYAQSLETIRNALLAFPNVAVDAVRLLLAWDPVRRLVRIAPSPGATAPVQAMHRLNMIRRAGYLVSAARRISVAVATRRPGKLERVATAFQHEQRFLKQHLNAVAGRAAAAQAVAELDRQLVREEVAGTTPGPQTRGLLGWLAVMDERTSKECRKAHGRNFDPREVPRIGFPGTVHPHCRCKPVRPFRTDLRVEDVRADLSEAVGGRARARVEVGSRASWTARDRSATLGP